MEVKSNSWKNLYLQLEIHHTGIEASRHVRQNHLLPFLDVVYKISWLGAKRLSETGLQKSKAHSKQIYVSGFLGFWVSARVHLFSPRWGLSMQTNHRLSSRIRELLRHVQEFSWFFRTVLSHDPSWFRLISSGLENWLKNKQKHRQQDNTHAQARATSSSPREGACVKHLCLCCWPWLATTSLHMLSCSGACLTVTRHMSCIQTPACITSGLDIVKRTKMAECQNSCPHEYRICKTASGIGFIINASQAVGGGVGGGGVLDKGFVQRWWGVERCWSSCVVFKVLTAKATTSIP